MRRPLGLTVVVVAAFCLAGAVPSWSQSAAEKPAPPAQDKAAAADAISGDWECTADLADGATPFTMKLKLDKDKVTGEVGGPHGVAPITDGSWVDGKLTVAFTYVDGASIVLTGSLAEGQLAGSLNYGGGQMVANWSAKKVPAK